MSEAKVASTTKGSSKPFSVKVVVGSVLGASLKKVNFEPDIYFPQRQIVEGSFQLCKNSRSLNTINILTKNTSS